VSGWRHLSSERRSFAQVGVAPISDSCNAAKRGVHSMNLSARANSVVGIGAMDLPVQPARLRVLLSAIRPPVGG
jgi:hypothetical protein